jgi:hypothetical protein
MKLAHFHPVEKILLIIQESNTGSQLAAKTPTIRTLIINLGILSLASLGFVTLLPVWAVDILEGDAATNGFLHTAHGLGALSGA